MKIAHVLSTVLLLAMAKNIFAQDAKITIRIIDETGNPVSNAIVNSSFTMVEQPGWGWGAGRPNKKKGISDTNGICVLEGSSNGGSVGIGASKNGFYGSAGYLVVFTNLDGLLNKKWQPWNTTVNVVMKPVGNPRPLYAKNVGSKSIPITGEPVGFDLKGGDWTAPYGEGDIADFLFRYDKQPEGSIETRDGPVMTYDYSLTITFSNEGDGLVPIPVSWREGGSALRLPRQAPESGYKSALTNRVYRGEDMEDHSDIREDQNYFFRVRTTKDEKGKVVSALYGKIHGDFQSDHLGKLTFTYYLNPAPNDRNLEFDPMKNLFKNLSPSEEVREP